MGHSNTGKAALGQPGQASAFLETLSAHIASTPDHPAVLRVEPDGSRFATSALTFAELGRTARAFAHALEQRGLQAGDRVLLSAADPRTVIAFLVGAMSRGIVTVPLQAVRQFRTPELFRERLATIAADCDPRLLVVEQAAGATEALGGLPNDVPCLDAQTLCGSAANDPASTEPLAVGRPANECAFIQYTSGSTRAARGVIVTHGNLSANVLAMGRASGMRPSDRFFSWLPLHHDMGLTGSLLYPLYWHVPACLMSPMAFCREPARWLRAIHQLRATLTVGPTFAYSLCAARIPARALHGVDLSSCRTAYCGAEPIYAEVVARFSTRFAPQGFRRDAFYPVYGLAETTLAASFPSPERPPTVDHVSRSALARGVAEPAPAEAADSLSFVSVGKALPQHELRVVHPTSGQPLPERRLGEVRLSGPSVSPRYHDEPASTERTELRTGDLGYLASGQLFVVDRRCDMVLLGGRSLSPADIEREAGRTRGVRTGRIVALGLRDAEGLELLHLVAELSPRGWRPQHQIARELVERVAARFQTQSVGVSLVSPGSVPRTTSGKLRRSLCRERLLEGAYPTTLSPRRRAALKWHHVLQQALQARRALRQGILG